ncbi:TetR/AcrR family transcriptional regulator [Devosia sp.]|uniref:TetR/AcrR family transcriptional regulator n=1 Tax=Devosia sp. TaxID=1871048 RepID=UPI002FCC7A0B
MSTRIAKSARTMRKQPRQARSRVMVEAVVEAGARVLSDQGWVGFTTNRVADVAGVAIGSLYQYFPDKLSLVEAVRNRHLADCLAVLQRCASSRAPVRQFVDVLVQEMAAAHSTHPGLHRVLLDEAPAKQDYLDPGSAYEIEYLQHYAMAIAACRPDWDPAAIQNAALLISDAVDGVIHNAARRAMLNDPALMRALATMIELYLSREG